MRKNTVRAFGVVLVLTVLGLIHIFIQYGSAIYTLVNSSFRENLPVPNELATSFWNGVFDIFAESKLDLTDDQLDKGVSYTKVPPGTFSEWSKPHLEAMADISPEFLHQLRLQHKNILRQLPRTLPASTYKAGTSGAVIVGGGRYSWLSHLAILSIRDTGCSLPVEVLIPTMEMYESDKDWCTKTLPQLNARCIVLPEILGPQVTESWGDRTKTYQYKALAVLVLSFEHALLLDSDNVVLQNPQPVFDSALYREYGMITWPDYWQRTFSPKFYGQLNIPVDETKRARVQQFPLVPNADEKPLLEEELAKVPFHDLLGAIPNLSTEAGQMFVNKRSHGGALLLALYYNVYGPKQYYRLFSLGAQGEGDKDTFVAAASVLGHSYYQVHSKIHTHGYFDSDNNYQGVAMRHADPLEDFKLLVDHIIVPLTSQPRPQKEQIEFIEKVSEQVFSDRSLVGSFAIHCNFPKLDPLQLRHHPLYDNEKTRLKHRMYGKFTLLQTKVHKNELLPEYIDFELQMWTKMSQMVCGAEKTHFGYFDGTDPQWLCDFTKNQVEWLRETTMAKPGMEMQIVRVH